MNILIFYGDHFFPEYYTLTGAAGAPTVECVYSDGIIGGPVRSGRWY